MKNSIKAIMVLVCMVGMVHPAFARDFSDLNPGAKTSNTFDYSDLAPQATQSEPTMLGHRGTLNRQSASWDFSDLGPTAKRSSGYDYSDLGPFKQSGDSWNFSDLGKDRSDIARFEVCNVSRTTVDYTVSGTRDMLKNNHCQAWTTRGPGVVKFDQSMGGGIQTKSYTVKEGSHYFKEIATGSVKDPSYIDLRTE